MISVGLIVALPGEKRTLTNARIHAGRFSRLNEHTLLCLSGVGPEKALAGAQLLIQEGCRALLSWGCAAAIAPEAKPGDLLVPKRVLGDDGKVFDVSCDWRQSLLGRLPAGMRIHAGDLLESRSIVETAADKRSLYERSGASGLDMESAAIARVASRRNLPFATIRAVVDPANMALPKAVADSVNREGEVDLGLLLLSIARYPSSIPGLIRLGRYFGAAQRSLRLAASELAFDFSPEPARTQISQ